MNISDNIIAHVVFRVAQLNIIREKHTITIINHTLLSTIRAVIGTLTCMSMVSNSTSDSECY